MDDARPILLAEDYEDDAKIIQVTLKKAGIINPIFVVPDGQDAIAYLSGIKPYADRAKFPLPAVLLLDLKMPRLDGFEVLQWCKTQPHLRNLLVVVLSGNRDLTSINRAYTLGAHSFLIKPLHLEDVANLTNTFKSYWNQIPGA